MRWMIYHVINRTLFIMMGVTNSASLPNIHGVPQGAVLLPVFSSLGTTTPIRQNHFVTSLNKPKCGYSWPFKN